MHRQYNPIDEISDIFFDLQQAARCQDALTEHLHLVPQDLLLQVDLEHQQDPEENVHIGK
jgi:hypothetical protein